MKPLFSWLQSIVSESNGEGSESRVSSVVVLYGSLALVWFSTVFKTDIPPSAQTVLMALIAGVVLKYGTNKFAPNSVASTAASSDKPVVP